MGNARLLPAAQTTNLPGMGAALTATLPGGGIDGSPGSGLSGSAAGTNADGTSLKLLSFDQLLQPCHHRHQARDPRLSQGFGKLRVLQAAKADFPSPRDPDPDGSPVGSHVLPGTGQHHPNPGPERRETMVPRSW